MRRRVQLGVLLLATTALAGPAAAEGDISSVQLSSGGLAEVVRTFEADGPAEIRLTVPTAQVDDVLKSIVVADPAGAVASVSLEGLNSLDEAFRTLSIRPDDLQSSARLAAAMRGFEADVDDGEGRRVRGVILGVDMVQRPSPGAPVAVPAVSLQTDEGSVRQVLLGPAATLTFPDKAVADRVAAAGRALRGGQDALSKTVLVRTRGTGRRTVSISTVAAAPVWKVSYRAIAGDDGKARLQGWAILENATGEDWKGVSVTLSSANPMALTQRLYALYWRPRQEVPIALPGGPVRLTVDDGGLSRRSRPMGEPGFEEGEADLPAASAADLAGGFAELQRMAPAEAASAAPMAMAPPSPPALPATAVEGDVGIRFTIPERLDLPAGQTLAVPIIDADYEAELVSLFDPNAGSRHPLAALFVENDTEGSVPPGIFTVYGAEGYLGDAQILGIPPGEKRHAAFAADPKVAIDRTVRSRTGIASVRASRGVLTVSRRNEQTTDYAITAPADRGRTVLIDHPRQIGWTIDTVTPVESDDGTRARLRTRVEPGQDATVSVTESIVTEEAVALMDSDADVLLQWAGTDGVDADTADRLKALAALRRAVARAEDREREAGQAIDDIDAEQARLRSNLEAVPDGSDLAKRYLDQLGSSEAAIADARARLSEARADTRARRAAYRDAVEAF